jgi:hypothetical protein
MTVAIEPPAALVMVVMPMHVALMREGRRRRNCGEQKAGSNGKADQEALHEVLP